MMHAMSVEAELMRVGNIERQDTITHLSIAHSLGQLNVEEFDQRITAATDATTVADLTALTADLQPTSARRASWQWGQSPNISRLLAAVRSGTAAACSRPLVRIAVAIVALNVLVWAY